MCSARMDAGLLDAYLRLLQSGSVIKTFLATLEAFHEEQLAAQIPAIPHETLIIWGARDQILPVRNARRFHRDLRNSHLEILDECGHFPHEEQAEKVNRFVLQFLTGLASARVESA